MAISGAKAIELAITAPSSATGAAKNVTHGAQQTEAGAIALRNNASLTTNAEGVTNVSGKGNKSNTVEYGGKDNAFNVVNNDPATAQLAIAANATLADKFASSLADLAAGNSANQAQTYQAIAGLAANQQNNAAAAAGQTASNADAAAASAETGGLSRFQKTFIAVAFVIVAGLVLLRKKS